MNMPNQIPAATRALVVKKMREVHYWAGQVLCAAQGLEYGCKFLLFILAEQKLIDYSPKDALALMEGDQKRTFGQIFNTLRRYIQFDAKREEQFLRALERRNFFIHDFYHARAESLATDAGRAEEIRSLKQLRVQFREADASTQSLIRPLFLHFYHKDIEEISKEAIDQIISDS
jgi:hypothetical protein